MRILAAYQLGITDRRTQFTELDRPTTETWYALIHCCLSNLNSSRHSILNIGNSPLDVQLSAVLVLRSMAAAPEASRHLVNSGLVNTLLNLLRAQQEDDEFVLQVCFENFS